MLNVYIADLTGLEESYDEKMNRLHRARAEKIKAYKMPADRIRGLGAGLLLEKGLEDYLRQGSARMAGAGSTEQESTEDTSCIPKDEEGRYIIEYAYGPQGKPYFKDYPEIRFSLSHSGNMAVLALSDGEVGIDVQENRGYVERIAKRFYHEEEWKMLENKDSVSECEKLFYQIWTGKEAYIKYTGKGMGQDLRSFYVDINNGYVVSADGETLGYQIIETDTNSYFCSLVFDKNLQKIGKIIKIHL